MTGSTKKGKRMSNDNTASGRTKSKAASYDPVFDPQTLPASSSWAPKTAATKKAEIVEKARRKEPKSSLSSAAARSLAVYTNPSGTAYDPVFTQKIRELKPNWFN